jgi:hypothetical protein
VVAQGGGGGGGAAPGGPMLPNFAFNAPGAPKFNVPAYALPTLDQAKAEPGYQFRLDSGRDALERSAAAQGRLRTGGTLQNIMEYGQNFGEQEYRNVVDRYNQGYDRRYRGAYDAFAPEYERWRINANAAKDAALGTHGAQLDRWRHDVMGGGGGGGGGNDLPYDLLPALPPMPTFGGGPSGYEVMGGQGPVYQAQGDPWTDDEFAYF